MKLIGSIYRLRRNGYSGPLFIGLALAACGIQLLVPSNTFGTSESYAVMEDWASEPAWGIFLSACSVHMIISSIKRKPEMVSIGALVAAFGWLVMWVSVVLGNPSGLLMPITFVMILRSMSIFREFSDRQHDPHLIGPEDPNTYPRKTRRELRRGSESRSDDRG